MAKVSIEVVPAGGSPNSHEVEIKDSGASLKEVIAASGLQIGKMNISVDGEPVETSKPHLVHIPAGAKITATEKVRGS